MLNGFGKKFELRTHLYLLSFIMLGMDERGKGIIGVRDKTISSCSSLMFLVCFSGIQYEASASGFVEDRLL